MDRNSILPAAMFTSPLVSRCNCEVNENLLSTKYDTFSFLHCSVLSRVVIAVNDRNIPAYVYTYNMTFCVCSN